MTFPANPADRSPKGDHNRRLSLGLEIEDFAAAAGLSVEQVRSYEFTDVDGSFDTAVADRVGETLQRLEADGATHVDNGPSPGRAGIATRIEAALHEEAFVETLSAAQIDSAEQLVSLQLAAVSPAIRLASFGERPRGPMRELVVGWEDAGASGETVIPLRAHAA